MSIHQSTPAHILHMSQELDFSTLMPAPIRVVLTPEEDRTLTELRLATTVPQRVRDRAHMIRLNAQGWNALAIGEMFECQHHTIRAALRRWQHQGLGELWDAPGRGTKPKWQEADMIYLEQCLEQQPRSYNMRQLAQILVVEREVELSADRIRRIIKKMAGDGNECGTVNMADKIRTTKLSSKRI